MKKKICNYGNGVTLPHNSQAPSDITEQCQRSGVLQTSAATAEVILTCRRITNLSFAAAVFIVYLMRVEGPKLSDRSSICFCVSLLLYCCFVD